MAELWFLLLLSFHQGAIFIFHSSISNTMLSQQQRELLNETLVSISIHPHAVLHTSPFQEFLH